MVLFLETLLDAPNIKGKKLWIFKGSVTDHLTHKCPACGKPGQEMNSRLQHYKKNGVKPIQKTGGEWGWMEGWNTRVLLLRIQLRLKWPSEQRITDHWHKCKKQAKFLIRFSYILVCVQSFNKKQWIECITVVLAQIWPTYDVLSCTFFSSISDTKRLCRDKIHNFSALCSWWVSAI